MKKIQINGKEFSRAIRICRKFAAKTATVMAIDIKDQFIIEVVKEKKAAEFRLPGLVLGFGWISCCTDACAGR